MNKFGKVWISWIMMLIIMGTQAVHAVPQKKKPQHIILMIGDGMGLAQLCAAYAANGNALEIFNLFKVMGLSLTSSADQWITDSAAGATAFSIGIKTNNGMLGLAPDSTKRKTIFEEALEKNFGLGLVTTCDLTHATPAAFYAHRPSREMHAEIAEDFYTSGIHCAFGGGLNWLNANKLGIEAHYEVYVGNQRLNLFSEKSYKKKITFYDTLQDLPKMSEGRDSLWLSGSTLQTLNYLDKNFERFMVVVEGSQIDWGGHDNDSDYVIRETIDFSKAVAAAVEWAKKDGETLVIVTADHETGGLSLPGYDSLNRRPIMHFVNTHHSGIAVPVFAYGPGAEWFGGVYENTEIYHRIRKILGWN